MSKYMERATIKRVTLLQMFYDRVEQMGEWYCDKDVTKDEVTNYLEGVVDMTRKLLGLFEEVELDEKPWHKCDTCEHLLDCIACGDMVDTSQPGEVHKFKPASTYRCPIQLPFEPSEDDDDESDI